MLCGFRTPNWLLKYKLEVDNDVKMRSYYKFRSSNTSTVEYKNSNIVYVVEDGLVATIIALLLTDKKKKDFM